MMIDESQGDNTNTNTNIAITINRCKRNPQFFFFLSAGPLFFTLSLATTISFPISFFSSIFLLPSLSLTQISSPQPQSPLLPPK
jgi:hypothetical protein